MVKQKLPHQFSYGVTLNDSYDGDREEDEMVFPEDDFRVVFDLDREGVVALLCRDERVPQWIDISVSGCDKGKSYLHLLCCGRYHSQEDRLYYYQQGTQPFGIKSPQLPKGFWPEDLEPNRRFRLPAYKVFQKSELWRRDQDKEAQQDVDPNA